MSVSPNVVAVAGVAMCGIPVHAMPVQAVRDPRVSSVPIMVSGGRRVCGGRRGREDKGGRAERDSRNSKSAKRHGNSLSCWAAQPRRGNTPLAPERYATPQMKPPSQVGNGENYPWFDSPDRGIVKANEYRQFSGSKLAARGDNS
jgi:hypothetical protein